MRSFRTKAEDVLGRLVAFVVLLAFLPSLLFIGLLLRAYSDEPVLLLDEVVASGGAKFQIHRFRTTGPGTNAFRAIGRFLGELGCDDLPALWDVVRGQLGLAQLYGLVKTQR